jgi:hypothetical protein
MTGTVSELCDCNEKETSNLNNFNLFSLWLFEKIKANRLLDTDLFEHTPILNVTSLSIAPGNPECIIAKTRERQRRERKEELYSCRIIKRNTSS